MATLLFFGRLADTFASAETVLDLPAEVTDTARLRAWLDTTHALGGALLEPTIRIAINDEIVAEPASLANTDTIALLPPVGGG